MDYLSVLNELKSDHQIIKDKISHFLQLSPLDAIENRSEIASFIKFVKLHHQKEEEVLFPFVDSTEWLKNGGPRCGFFMGQILDLRIHDSFLKTLSKHNVAFQPDLRKWMTPGSPLAVPLNEHDMGDAFAMAISSEIERAPSEIDSERLDDLLRDYFALIEVHRAKEDECLFILIERRLQRR